MTYHYVKENDPGDLWVNIHEPVIASEMTDKSIQWCRWDEDEKDLEVVFEGELSSGDKTILDGIVAGV